LGSEDAPGGIVCFTYGIHEGDTPPSTNRALCRLTSEVERDLVHLTRYGRQREHMKRPVNPKATTAPKSIMSLAAPPCSRPLAAAPSSPRRSPIAVAIIMEIMGRMDMMSTVMALPATRRSACGLGAMMPASHALRRVRMPRRTALSRSARAFGRCLRRELRPGCRGHDAMSLPHRL
jgi:hypothetical protein